jgi:hypothetical protein
MRLLSALLVVAWTGTVAWAQPPASPAPPPYSLPWLLRPATPATVLRLDETMAFYEDPATGAGGGTYVTSLIASYKLSPRLVPLFRLSWIHDDSPTAASGSGFSNPLVGINYLRPFGRDWRWSGFFATTLPIGAGGGDSPDAGASGAMNAAIPARSSMDNALFAVNYWTVIGGLGLARVTPGLTLQAEVTILQLTRVRGPDTQDKHRTNMTSGIHAGHFFSPRVSFGAEARMQVWLTDAAPVRNDPQAREQLTFALGPRLHFRLAGGRWLRPGLSYTRAFDDPMAGKSYDILQVDVPLAF